MIEKNIRSRFLYNFQWEHHCVKQFGSRSIPTFCWTWSGSKMFEKNIRYFSFLDPVQDLIILLIDALESSCTKRLSLRSGLAYQWRTLYGFNVFDNNIRYAYVSKMFHKSIAQLMHHSVKMFGCRSGSRFCRTWYGSKPMFEKNISRRS